VESNSRAHEEKNYGRGTLSSVREISKYAENPTTTKKNGATGFFVDKRRTATKTGGGGGRQDKMASGPKQNENVSKSDVVSSRSGMQQETAASVVRPVCRHQASSQCDGCDLCGHALCQECSRSELSTMPSDHDQSELFSEAAGFAAGTSMLAGLAGSCYTITCYALAQAALASPPLFAGCTLAAGIRRWWLGESIVQEVDPLLVGGTVLGILNPPAMLGAAVATAAAGTTGAVVLGIADAHRQRHENQRAHLRATHEYVQLQSTAKNPLPLKETEDVDGFVLVVSSDHQFINPN
jgi:hypothetical protein